MRLIDIPIRIIVISELKDKELITLRVMTPNAKEDDVRQFLEEASKYTEPGDRRNADAVLQISAKANEELYTKLEGVDSMNEALRRIMSKELIEAENEGIEKGIDLRDKEKISEMLNDGKSPEAISDFCKYPLEQVLKVQEELPEYG